MALAARINIVTLGVGDLERSRDFYTRLGWQQAAASNDRIAWFKLTGSILGIFPFDELIADYGGEPVELPRFSGVTLAINLGSTDEVDEALRAAEAAGGRIVKPGTRMDWGGYSGYFADPDGYLWEVAWNPFFPMSAEGMLTLD